MSYSCGGSVSIGPENHKLARLPGGLTAVSLMMTDLSSVGHGVLSTSMGNDVVICRAICPLVSLL